LDEADAADVRKNSATATTQPALFSGSNSLEATGSKQASDLKPLLPGQSRDLARLTRFKRGVVRGLQTERSMGSKAWRGWGATWTLFGVVLPLLTSFFVIAPAPAKTRLMARRVPSPVVCTTNECAVHLRMLYQQETARFRSQRSYTTDLDELNVPEDADGRYRYVSEPSEGAAQQLPVRLAGRVGIGLSGRCPACDVTLACSGQLDDDPAVDVWSISTSDRIGPNGEFIRAGVPFHDVDDAVTTDLVLDTFPSRGLVEPAPPAPEDVSANTAEASH
jgi:hypothetical protein